MKKLKVILIGAGLRGIGYTDIAMADMPDRYEVVAVAEPVDDRRRYIQQKHGLKEEMCFTDWKPLLAMEKSADVAFICTMDRDHIAPTLAAIAKGYDIMLEKPIAPTPEDCVRITKAADAAGVKVLICHVLRFTPFYGRLKQLILSGLIGKLQVLTQTEQVGLVHQSHSFVRGNWGNSERSSCMLLQKSCHDLDIIEWLIDSPCRRVQSFGSLRYFTEENAPEGAPERCLDGCPAAATCPFNAQVLYLDHKDDAWFRCAATQKTHPTDEDVRKALNTTNYGRCVFRCDNDVVDRQVVNMEYDNGVVAAFTMTAFNLGRGGREIRIMGTKGALLASMTDQEIMFQNFETGKVEMLPVIGGTGDGTIVGGHGGGDFGIMDAFYQMECGEYRGVSIAPIDISCRNHMTAFAAERSRETGEVVDVDAFSREYGL